MGRGDKITGDLLSMALEGRFDIIAHGCNCQHTMEKGVALAVKRVFPEAWKADQATAKGDRAKLGRFSRAWVDLKCGKKLLVVNLYTQFFWGTEEQTGETLEEKQGAIASSAVALADLIKKNAYRAPWAPRKPVLGIPRIGAGLAGGDWEVNRALILAALSGCAKIVEVHFPQEARPLEAPSLDKALWTAVRMKDSAFLRGAH
jgi:O-acetyl-ADP-ribose deacetylase (regulator of RNase III)